MQQERNIYDYEELLAHIEAAEVLDVDYTIRRTSEMRKRFFSDATITVWTFTVMGEIMALLFQEYLKANISESLQIATVDDKKESQG
jgi:hypothetical protein